MPELPVSPGHRPNLYPWRRLDQKGDLHDYLKNYPNTVVVNISPYPYLIPAVSYRGEKYVRSAPDDWKHDDLMDLPRE